MNYTPFRNFEEFKELFGMKETPSGLVRKNKILLTLIKSEDFRKYALSVDEAFSRTFLMEIRDMTSLYENCINQIECYGNIRLLGFEKENIYFSSSLYDLDEYQGLCEDGDYRSIRYINKERGKVFKMKAGRFFKSIILDSDFGRHLPEPVVLWLCEEFSRRWETISSGADFKLHVDNDFERIYDGYECPGNFHSCMTDKGFHSFYSDSVKAKAAYLTNDDEKIVARCIIFTEVKDDETGEILRLAERQYSTESKELYMRILIDKLIEAGEIDGYKAVGAGCGEANRFVSKDGESWSDRKFSIDCNLDYGDCLSYQDSFKWYDMDSSTAYNYYVCGYLELDTTNGDLGGGEYDSWNDRYCEEVVTVYSGGREYTCDSEDLDEFCWIEGIEEYHHRDDCAYSRYYDRDYLESDVCWCEKEDDYFPNEECIRCDECGNYIWLEGDNCFYSELTEEDYCCAECMEQAEKEYKERNWFYAEFDDEYREDSDDVVNVYEWSTYAQSYVKTTALKETAEEKFFLVDGEYYENLEGFYPTDSCYACFCI